MASRSKKDDESTEAEAPEEQQEQVAEGEERSVDERQAEVAKVADDQAKRDSEYAESSVKAGDLPQGLTRAQFIAQQEAAQHKRK